MITIFYGNQVYAEYPDWRATRGLELPDDCYIYDGILWYHHCYRMSVPVELNEVPAMCKAWALILGD